MSGYSLKLKEYQTEITNLKSNNDILIKKIGQLKKKTVEVQGVCNC